MVSKKLDHMSLYLDIKQKNDDKLADQKDTWELKDNFIERTYVRTLLTSIDKAIGEDGRSWISIEERYRDFTDKFEKGTQISIRIPTADEAEAESIRGKLQLVFRSPAYRDLNSMDGKVSYKFESTFPREEFKDETYLSPGMVTVYISNGSLAESCEIIEVEDTFKRYEIKCPEGMEVVND